MASPDADARPTEIVLTAPQPPGEPQVWTLEQFEEDALACNPELMQAWADVAAAAGRAQQSGAYPNPLIGYAGYQMGASAHNGQQGFFLTQDIPWGEKLTLNVTRGDYETCRTRWQAVAQRYRLVNNVRIRYYRVLWARRLVRNQEQLLHEGEQLRDETPRLIKAEAILEADALQTELILHRARTDLAALISRQQIAWQELMALTGQPCRKPVDLCDILDRSHDELVCDEVLNCILANSPELAAAHADVARAETGLRREQIEPYPNANIWTGTQYDTATEKEQVNVAYGLVVPLWNKNRGGIRAAEADLCRARAEVRRIEISLRQRFVETFSRYQEAKKQLAYYCATLIPQAHKVFQERLTEIRKKQGSWSDVLDAYARTFEFQANYVEQLTNLRVAEVTLCGMLLADSGDSP